MSFCRVMGLAPHQRMKKDKQERRVCTNYDYTDRYKNKEFTRGVRGYKEDEVDSFLDIITLDLEVLIQENRNLKGSLSLLTQEVERYRDSEKTVLETLEAAKALMADISKSSEKKAEILIKNAEFDAERIIRGAKDSVLRLTEEAATLRNRISILKTRYKTLLETELERFDSLSAELFPEAFADGMVVASEDQNDIGLDTPSSKNERLKAGSKTISNVRTG